MKARDLIPWIIDAFCILLFACLWWAIYILNEH